MKRSSVNDYLVRLAISIGVEIRDLMSAMMEKECLNCGAIYLDPYLTEYAEAKLYDSSPEHRRGLERLDRRLASASGREDIVRLTSLASSRLGPIERYGEVGCPFQGALLEHASHQRLRSLSRALRWRHARRALALDTPLSIRRTSISIIRRSLVTASPPQPPGVFTKGLYLEMAKPCAWLQSCASVGTACSEIARRLTESPPRPVSDLDDRELDLVGIFNWLDHVSAPADLLRSLQRISSAMLVAGHLAHDAGLQHRFGLTLASLRWLARHLDMELVDLSTSTMSNSGGTYAVLLVSAEAVGGRRG